MRRLLISSIFTFFILVIYIYVTVFKSIETLTYFPKDDLDTFLSSHTRLQLAKNQTLKWTSSSETKVQPYLRQDISLLYENGKFKGAVNLWKEGKKRLNQQKKIPLVGNKLYETISFHHSEIHRNDDNITSNQQMSADYLYVYVNKQHHHSFKQTKTKLDQKVKENLQQKKMEYLTKSWNELIDYFNIDVTNYILIPLTDLIQFKDHPLPSLSQEKTDRVIGQLWEGLYKNYIIPLTNKMNEPNDHMMPLILVDKKLTHLYVLFELNDEKIKLKQLI